jgi:transposase-like protein
MTARKITAKERATSTPRLHLDEKTGATVLTPKVRKVTRATPVKHSALRDDKLSLRIVKTAPVKVTKSSLVRAEFEKGASLTEAAKATGVDPAFIWDLAKAWQEKTGRMVPRNGRAPKVVVAVAKAPAVKKTPAKKVAAVATEKAEDTCLHCGEARIHANHQLLPPTDGFHAFEEATE